MNFKIVLITLSVLILNASSFSKDFFEDTSWIAGMDVSYLNQMEDHGAVYNDMGIEKDALQILKDHWINTVRLRLWYSPSDKYCGLEETINMAKRIKTAGLKFILDIHYSDTWADIVNQPKPASWENLSSETLKDSVYSYTKRVIQVLKNENALPDIVQIGNEIAHGMLWNDGRVGDAFHTPQQWLQFSDLIKAGIQGVRDNEEPGQEIKTMIHIHCGGDNGFSTWFFDNLIANGVDFDIIGLSFYTFWGHTLQHLQTNINSLALQYQKDIVVVETAYPWSLNNFDYFPNSITDTTQLQTGYEASVEGQKKFLQDIISIVRNVPDNRGKGVIYYSPEYIPSSGMGSSCDNTTLFNPTGGLLESIDAFNPDGVNRISLNLNSASIPDTLGANSFFEVRGSVDDTAPVTLPDAQILDWSENSTIELEHVRGDYFTTTFYAPYQSQIHFKFWSKEMVELETNGWEVGVTGTNQNGDMFLTVSGDTTLPLHFFNGLGEQKPYEWIMWLPKNDKIAVWFRVYMYTEDAVVKGYVLGEGNIIGIRGDPRSGVGPLSWGTSEVLLHREVNDQNKVGYHLFSAVVYFPKSLIGDTQKYKFFIEPNGWENGEDRFFKVPASDSTLHWVYYSNSPPFQGQVKAENELSTSIKEFSLLQNYPNPFNPMTTITFELPERSNVAVIIFNQLGEKVEVLMDRELEAGIHSAKWDAGNLVSGLYFYKLRTEKFTSVKKLLLMK